MQQNSEPEYKHLQYSKEEVRTAPTLIVSRADSSFEVVRATITTFAPLAASWQATDFPIPSEPPVITAVYQKHEKIEQTNNHQSDLTLLSTSNSFFEPNPNILAIVVYMMILHKTNVTPKVAGDRSERDNEDIEYMKGRIEERKEGVD